MLASAMTILDSTMIQKLPNTGTQLYGHFHWVQDTICGECYTARDFCFFPEDPDICFNIFEMQFGCMNTLTYADYLDLIHLITKSDDIIHIFIDGIGQQPLNIDRNFIINTIPEQLSLQLFTTYGSRPLVLIIRYSASRFPGYIGG